MSSAKRVKRRPYSPIGLGLLTLVLVLWTARTLHDTIDTPRLQPDLFLPPTRLYARPLALTPGALIDRERLEATLGRLGYRPTTGPDVKPGEYALRWDRWVIGRRPFRYPYGLEAGGTIVVREGYDGRIASVEDASGHQLSRATLEPELLGSVYGPDRADRVPITLADVPRPLLDAILTVEDQRFYRHHGLDLRRILAAAWANLRAGRIVQGGSTLTQQLVKNLWLSPSRSPIRKMREAAMSLVLEGRYTKDEILTAYLNEVYLGQDGAVAIRGVGRAAEYYFGTDITRIDLAEAATLAGLIRGPSLYSPLRNPEAARGRRDQVLGLMRERGVIDEAAYRRALETPLRVRDPPEPDPGGGYFARFVEARLRASLGKRASAGLTVFTTLEPALQRAAEGAVRDGLRGLELDAPYLVRPGSPLQAALVVLDPRTGRILAMVGGRDFTSSPFNRATEAHRQPGSAFKPIVALAALTAPDRGQASPFTLATILQDEPLSVKTAAGTWSPTDYDDAFRGPVTLREALEHSLNVPFARLGLAVGPKRIAAAGRRLGITSPLHPVPSLALGSSEVTPLELTRAYGVIAAGGYRAELRAALDVLDPEGRSLEGTDPAGERVYEPAQAYLVTSALRGAVERGTGRGLRTMGYRGQVAAKSGTSDDFRDAWFVGYTPSLAVGAWVGYDDGHTVGLPGARAALPIFGRFLLSSFGPDGDGEFSLPDGLEIAEIDPRTGRLAGPGCPRRPEVFLEGTVPDEVCTADRRWGGRYQNLSELRRSLQVSEKDARRLIERLLQRLRNQRP